MRPNAPSPTCWLFASPCPSHRRGPSTRPHPRPPCSTKVWHKSVEVWEHCEFSVGTVKTRSQYITPWVAASTQRSHTDLTSATRNKASVWRLNTRDACCCDNSLSHIFPHLLDIPAEGKCWQAGGHHGHQRSGQGPGGQADGQHASTSDGGGHEADGKLQHHKACVEGALDDACGLVAPTELLTGGQQQGISGRDIRDGSSSGSSGTMAKAAAAAAPRPGPN